MISPGWFEEKHCGHTNRAFLDWLIRITLLPEPRLVEVEPHGADDPLLFVERHEHHKAIPRASMIAHFANA